MTDFELPDFLEEETEETILNRMLDSLPDDMDKSEGSYIWASLSPVAIELAKVVEWGREVLRRGMTTETFGVYLDMRAADQGISRREAESSTVPVTLTGEPGTTIPEGTRVATPSDNTTPSIEFVTDEEVSIPESGEVATTATAIEPGASGDVPQGSVSIILPGISGVTSVTNPESGSGGYDRETDESLLARVYENSQQDEGDGNIDDYKMWAKQITGVGNVLVDPLWNGPGTIRAVILSQSGGVASQDLIDEVQEHLDPEQKGIGEGKAPSGSKVTVTTADTVLMTATIPNLEASAGYTHEQVQSNASDALRDYLKNINPGGVVRVREAQSEVIKAEGVLDTGDLLLDDSRNNITLSTTELADLGEVTFS